MKVLGIAIGGFVAAFILVMAIGSNTGIPDTGGQPSLWKVVGRVPDKLKPIFVELDQTAVAVVKSTTRPFEPCAVLAHAR